MQITLKDIGETLRNHRLDEWHVYLALANGNHAAAFLLRRVIWWTANPSAQDRGGWFYKTQQEWKDECGLTRSKLESARKSLPFLEHDPRNDGYRRRTWYKLNIKKFLKAFTALIKKLTSDTSTTDSVSDSTDSSTDHGTEIGTDPAPVVEKPHTNVPKFNTLNVIKLTNRCVENLHINTSTYSKQKDKDKTASNAGNLSVPSKEIAFNPTATGDGNIDTVISDDALFNTPRKIFDFIVRQCEYQLDRATFTTFVFGAQLKDYRPDTNTYTVETRSESARAHCENTQIRRFKRIFSDITGTDNVNFTFTHTPNVKPALIQGA